MNDMIAVLDGFNGVSPSGSNGANYSGGGAFYDGAPVFPADSGLALAAAALPEGVFPEGVDSFNEGWGPNGRNAEVAEDEFASYLAAYTGNRVATHGHISPSGSNGANYSGGGAFYDGAPVFPADSGLAAYDMQVHTNPSGSGGANYSGGSSFYAGAPIMPNGLAALRRRAAIHALNGLGASPARIVAAVRRAMDRPVTGTPCDQAFKTAYNAALSAGYDRQWAASAANAVLNQCMALGWVLFSTRA